MLGFKECAPFFPKGPHRNHRHADPHRAETAGSNDLARQKLGLRHDLTTLLVMGGSQGASGINQADDQVVAVSARTPLQIIHLTGSAGRTAGGRQLSARKYSGLRGRVSSSRWRKSYSAADLVIARSGAASLAEIASLRPCPAILIPFPYAADDHQTRNAEIFVRAGAAILLKESEFR